VLAIGATVALLAGLGWGGPAQASTVDHGTLVGSVTPRLALPTQVAGVVAPSWCQPKFDHYNRTQLCWGELVTLDIYDFEGELIGTLQLYLFQAIHLTQQRKNHDAVCNRKITGPPPKGKSCDEYPFASTYEGGTTLSKANRGWAWVPASEQNRQGGLLTGFYNANRVLSHDAFWVKV
jgi:hypothetical protein